MRRVDRAFGGTCSDERVQLVDEQDDLLVLRDLVHDRLEALFELTAVLGAGDDRGHVERQHAVVAQRLRALAVRDELRESFDDRRLADAGLTDQHRIVLLPAREHFHDALDLLRPPDRRIELTFGGELREIAAEVVERRRLGLLFALGRGLRRRGTLLLLRTTLRHLGAEDAQRLGAGGVEVHARVGQHLRRNPLFFAEKAKQQVLSADVAVIELARFAHGELEHFLRARRVGQVGPGGLAGFSLLDRLFDLLLDVVQLDAEVLEHRRCDALTLADQAEQDVLGPHVFVVETRGLLASHREDFPHPLGEVVAVHCSLTSG